MKKVVLLLVLFGLAFQSTSCKSKNAQDDTEIVENADVEKIEAEDSELLTSDNSANDVGPVDESLQAALGETSTTAATDPTLTTTDAAITESKPTEAAPEIAAAPSLDEQTLENPAPVDTTTNAVSDPTAASTGGITETPIAESSTDAAMAQGITESPVLSEPTVTASETTAVTKTTPAAPSSSGSLKKIAETAPYQFGEGWVNTVYISRPKEKLKDISQKIYGMDKTKELKKINSFLAARSPKGGDKIYYVSPNRSNDSMSTISFYEDTGMIAETYVAQKGDNLKKVAKELLGYSDAYKEIWTTNPVASKEALTEGEALRYWKANTTVIPSTVADNSSSFPTGGAAQVINSTSQLPSQPVAQEMTPPSAPSELPLPPPADMAPPVDQLAQNTPPPPADMTELPPPPPPPPPADTTAAAEMTPPPPPPPTEDLAAAPVEPQKKVVTPNMEEEEASSEAMNSDTTMMLGGVVVLCSLLAFALIRRNKKKKEIEMASMSETNVGT